MDILPCYLSHLFYYYKYQVLQACKECCSLLVNFIFIYQNKSIPLKSFHSTHIQKPSLVKVLQSKNEDTLNHPPISLHKG